MRFRFGLLAMVMVLLASACGSSGGDSGDSGLGGGATTTTVNANTAACKNAKLTSPEKGVTEQDDHGHRGRRRRERRSGPACSRVRGRREGVGRLHQRQRRPRVPQGRGEGGRLEAEPDRRRERGRRPRAANSLALVGTTALFLQDMSAIEHVQGQGGQRRRASPTSRCCRPRPRSSARRSRSPTLPTGVVVPVQRQRARALTSVGYTQYDYYFNKYGEDALHGVFVDPEATCRRRSRRRCRSSAPRTRWASRATPSSA